MSNVRPIRNEADYNLALERIESLMGATAGTTEFDELDVLSTLIELYEEDHFPIDFPSPIQAIEFRMEQEGLSQADLAKYIGSRSKVSEVLSGKRPLTLKMIRALNLHLGIPAEVLIGDNSTQELEDNEIQWSKFPIFELSKRGWLPNITASKENAHLLMGGLIANGPKRAVEALNEHGVAVVYAKHLPKTHLDGAAMRTKEGVPVIGLTLRYDRLDNFWFCLLHEVAHIWKHVSSENSFFVDDLSLNKSDHDEDWSIELRSITDYLMGSAPP